MHTASNYTNVFSLLRCLHQRGEKVWTHHRVVVEDENIVGAMVQRVPDSGIVTSRISPIDAKRQEQNLWETF
jgi:hypothetical protein